MAEETIKELKEKYERIAKILEIGKLLTTQKDIDGLLKTIVKETTNILNAELASLFLYDEKSDELWLKVSIDLEVGKIRFKSDKGIAGYVAQKREILNIEDAYSHNLFNPEFDKKSGFKTKTILCAPMENLQGTLIGVIQVLNKQTKAFNKEDEDILVMLASQAAISIENSRLTDYLRKSYFSLQVEKEKILKEIGEKEVKASKGEIVGFRKYVIGELLGKGAYGEVYIAREVSELGEWPVAIKVLRDETFKDPVQVEKTKEEGKLVRKYLNGHQNIVSTYFVDIFSGSPYIVMEYIDGITLELFNIAHKNSGRKIPVYIMGGIIKELCTALTHAWEVEKEDGTPLNMVHRDIKPGNIMLSKDGVPKLTDFGIATEGRASSQRDKTITGTPNYMSPEQAKGLFIDDRSDIFSLGLIFYSLLFGDSPYRTDNTKKSLEKARQCEIPEPPIDKLYPGEEFKDLRDSIAFILKKSLAKDPKDRYQSATQMYEAIHLDMLSPSKITDTLSRNYVRKFIKDFKQKKDRGVQIDGDGENTTL